jgi:hypothetical protein
MANTPSNSAPNDDAPLDDYGIGQDRIIELCEKIVDKIYTKCVLDNSMPSSIGDLKEIVLTLEGVWRLVKDMLDIDDVIRSAMEAIVDGKDISFDDGDDKEREDDEGGMEI